MRIIQRDIRMIIEEINRGRNEKMYKDMSIWNEMLLHKDIYILSFYISYTYIFYYHKRISPYNDYSSCRRWREERERERLR